MKKAFKIFVVVTFVVYVLVLVRLVFMGSRSFWRDMSIWEYALARMNLVPFKTIVGYIKAIINDSMNLSIPLANLFGNLLMFLPMGIYLPWLFQKLDSWKKYLTAILVILFGVEIVQLLTKLGSFDIDDLILNMTGALMGFVLWKTTLVQCLKRMVWD